MNPNASEGNNNSSPDARLRDDPLLADLTRPLTSQEAWHRQKAGIIILTLAVIGSVGTMASIMMKATGGFSAMRAGPVIRRTGAVLSANVATISPDYL